MKLIPKKHASVRTKNRVKEHGPFFEIKDAASSVIALNDNEGLLVESRKDNWIGWLPADEVIIDNINYGGFGQSIE
jgi:hypothetical protein